jgi:hypothetical protein
MKGEKITSIKARAGQHGGGDHFTSISVSTEANGNEYCDTLIVSEEDMLKMVGKNRADKYGPLRAPAAGEQRNPEGSNVSAVDSVLVAHDVEYTWDGKLLISGIVSTPGVAHLVKCSGTFAPQCAGTFAPLGRVVGVGTVIPWVQADMAADFDVLEFARETIEREFYNGGDVHIHSNVSSSLVIEFTKITG